MIRIYGLFTPMFRKTVYAAEELGVRYEIVPINLMKGEQQSPEHLARHPFGKVPAIEHNGNFLFESNTIIRYMGDIAPSPAFPAEPMARAKVDQWIEYFAHQAGRWTTGIWFDKVIGPKNFNELPDPKKIGDLTEWLMADMPKIDAHLETNQYMAGANFSLADVVAHMLMGGFKAAELPLGDFKNFIRWFEKVESRPSFLRATLACDAVEAKARAQANA
jgi:glutathione S-transferase